VLLNPCEKLQKLTRHPGGCSSPAKGWAKTLQMAPPLAQSSPPGKEEQGRRESERREKFKKQREEMNLRGPVNEPSSSEPGT
jgi:hypothetical protein